ncbi:hypothetical protein BaRGS_00012016, partial [Batillaria attramentaria]
VFVIADVFLCTVSILHLVGLAVDRYLAVCRPFLHERLGITSARVACVAVWVLPGVLEMDVGNDSNGRCLLQLSQSDGCTFYTASPIFHSLVASLSFFLPLLIIVVLHVRICVAAHTQVRKLAKLQPSPWPSAELLADDNSGNVGQGHRIDPQAAGREDEEARFHDVAPSTSSREGQRETEHLGREKANKQPEETRAIKTVVCLVLCFVVCWAPLFVFFLLESFFGHNSPLYVLPILSWLGYLNSAINPVLYYCYNVAVRCAIRSVYSSLDILLCTASILHLVGLALDRYLAICWPFLHHRLGTTSARALCALFWLVAILVSVPPLVRIYIYSVYEMYETC